MRHLCGDGFMMVIVTKIYKLEPPHFMFWNKNKNTRYTHVNLKFYYTNVGFKGIYISRTCFPDVNF